MGALTGLSGRLTYLLSEGVMLRAVARAGSSGIDLEVGALRKWDAGTTGEAGGRGPARALEACKHAPGARLRA